MDNNFFWDVFTNTGSVESYLAYKSAESIKTNDTQTQNTNGEKK
jgi:hypothetical protein